MADDLYADRITFPAVQDVISWYSQGRIQAVQMRRTYEHGELETYHVVIAVRKAEGER